MIENNNYFIDKSFNNYLIPSILSILGGNVSIMIDNCIAGAVLGEKALAAMSIVNPVFNIITAFGLLICGGASTLASVSIGRSAAQKKYIYFTLTVYMILAVGGMLTASGLMILDPLIVALGAKGDLFSLARDYCRVMICGSVALIAVYLPLNFFRIEGRARISMVMFFLMSVLDIVLDLLFVIVFKWGMPGLALATVLSTLIAVAAVFPLLLTKRLGYRLVKLHKPVTDIKEILTRGSPVAFGNLYTVIRVRVVNGLLLSCGGSLALAAYTCANNVNIIGMALITGISQTVAPIMGVLYGERNGDGIKRITKKATLIGIAATAGFSLLAAAFSQPLAMLFGMSSPEQLAAARITIMILSTNLIFVGLSSVLIYSYMTCGHTALANALTLAKGIVFNLLFAILGTKLLGFIGLILGLALSEAVTVLLALAAAKYKRRKNSDYEGILLLSRKIFAQGHSMACSVQNCSKGISEAAELSALFCKENGLALKKATTVSLGVEEIMVLMSKYALAGSKDCMEFRLFISELETVVRIRCAGRWFNPLCFEAKDDFDNIGVKMLLKMATELSYSTNLGMNNIRITI